MEFKKGDDVFGWDKDREFGHFGKYFAFDDYSKDEWKNTHIILSERIGFICHFDNCEPLRPGLKVNDPVVVWNVEGAEHNRHFARWGEDGRIIVFTSGTTSWSEDCGTTAWDHYRLPTKDELKG